MIEAIQIAADAAQAASAASASQPQAQAFEISQFAQAYANGGAPAAGASVAPAQAPGESMRALSTMFDKLNGGANDIKTMAARLASANEESKPSEMLALTFACHQFMFKAEITSNVANRTSDGITQLFRQQS